MACDEHDESEYNIEDSTFCFFEFFLFASRYQYEPSSIDDEYHTDHREECVEKSEQFAHDPDATSKIYFFDITGTDRYEASCTIITSRTSIECSHDHIWYLDQEEPHDSIDYSVV